MNHNMIKKERIENNPFRILGLYVGMPKSVEVSRLNRIRAFSNVGQEASFELRGDDVLQPIARTKESAETAAQTLSLPKDRIENSLLWFSDGTKDWGMVLNEAVQGLLDNDYTKAINSYNRLISDNSLRIPFIESITNGLMTLSADELTVMISDLILSCEDNLDEYWMSSCQKPSGNLAFVLFDKSILNKLENLIQSIGKYNSGKIDFYARIAQFENTLTEIKPILEAFREVYGEKNIMYLTTAEQLYKSICEEGGNLIDQIGGFIWRQEPQYLNYDNSYKKYRSKMPIECVKECMRLMARVDEIVYNAGTWINPNETSKSILYSDIRKYQSIKRNEFVESKDIIRRSVMPFYIKKGITITAWLSALYFFFFYL